MQDVAVIFSLYVGHILGDLTRYSAVSAVISAGRRWISARGYRVMIGPAAAMLFAMAAWFLASGLRSLCPCGVRARAARGESPGGEP